MNPHNLAKLIPLAVGVTLAPLLLGGIIWTVWYGPEINKLQVVQTNPFTPIQLEAKSAIVYDPINNKVIFAKNEDEILPIASITKLMTAHLASKNLNTEQVVITPDGKKWRWQDLLDFTLVTSSNEGAESLAAAVASSGALRGKTFTEAMNTEAQNLGLFNTHFLNPTGLDVAGTPGAKSTAFEIARLMSTILGQEPNIVAATNRSKVSVSTPNGPLRAENTNLAADLFPGLIASKTGFTRGAGGSLVVAIDVGLNEPVIVVVLGSSEEGRIEDARKLALAAVDYSSQVKLMPVK